jgi:hypothetical protein
MSQSFEVDLLLATTAALFHFGRALGSGKGEAPAHERHLLRRETQITDGNLLRQTLKQMGLSYREGDPEQMWGGEIDLQVMDDEGRPWFAMAWDEAAQAYVIYSPDLEHSQEDLPPEARLSERDPMPVLGRVAQQYGYLKTLRALLEDGYETQGDTERQADGSQALVLKKQDPERGEVHTVRMVFKPQEGRAAILTDSRKADGTHGVCPDIDRMLQSIGVEQYDKWSAPVSKAASAPPPRSASSDEAARPPAPPRSRQQGRS